MSLPAWLHSHYSVKISVSDIVVMPCMEWDGGEETCPGAPEVRNVSILPVFKMGPVSLPMAMPERVQIDPRTGCSCRSPSRSSDTDSFRSLAASLTISILTNNQRDHSAPELMARFGEAPTIDVRHKAVAASINYPNLLLERR